MNDVPQAPPVACSLSQADLASRAARWRVLAEAALQYVSATPAGQRLTFTASQETAGELRGTGRPGTRLLRLRYLDGEHRRRPAHP